MLFLFFTPSILKSFSGDPLAILWELNESLLMKVTIGCSGPNHAFLLSSFLAYSKLSFAVQHTGS